MGVRGRGGSGGRERTVDVKPGREDKLLYALRVLHFDRAGRRRIDYDVEDTVVDMLIAEVLRFPVPHKKQPRLALLPFRVDTTHICDLRDVRLMLNRVESGLSRVIKMYSEGESK